MSDVQLVGLTKSFDDTKALDGLSLEIRKGECFGILGPNGAGKSTLLKILYGHLRPTSGKAFVMGMDGASSGRSIRQRLGVVPQDEGLDVELTVLENMTVFASFFSIDKKTARDRSIELLKMVRLDDVIDKSVDQLSGGMKRRLVIARSLINHPDLVILDEPTVGLDPQIRMWVWDFLQKIKSQGTTMILTTHYMEEAESLCDRLAILDKGKLLAVGSPKELIETQLAENILEFEIDPTEMQYYLNRIKTQGFKYFVVGRQVFVSYPQAEQSNSILAMVNSRKISIRKTSLSDVFLSLAGHDLKEF